MWFFFCFCMRLDEQIEKMERKELEIRTKKFQIALGYIEM